MNGYRIDFSKGRPADEPGAKWWGFESRAGTAARRIEGSLKMRRPATKLGGENISPPKNFSPVFSEPEAAKQFSAVILPFSVGELALAADRSKETAKCWKNGRAFPNGVSLMALMAEFPVINAWVKTRTGGFDSPLALAEGFAMLEKIMAGETPEARAMRARVMQLVAERGNG